MSSALTDHLQIFEHHHFPGMKGLVGAHSFAGEVDTATFALRSGTAGMPWS